MNFDKPFWKTVLRDSDGSASSSRLLSAAIVLAALIWVSYVTGRTKVIPNLQPVGEFICTTTLSMYGVNKVAQVANNVFGKSDPKVPTE